MKHIALLKMESTGSPFHSSVYKNGLPYCVLEYQDWTHSGIVFTLYATNDLISFPLVVYIPICDVKKKIIVNAVDVMSPILILYLL